MGKTIIEKILSANSKQVAKPGDIVIAQIDSAMVHDINGPATIDCLAELNTEMKLPSKNVAFFLDHYAPCPTINAANAHNKLRDFAKKQGIKVFQPGEGICHQLFLENGYALPGKVCAGTDSHTCTYGALNSLGISIGATEMAVILACGQCWLKVPETILVTLTGEMPWYLTAKDIALHLIKIVTEAGAIYQCIEFNGDTLKQLSIDSRIVICNMLVEMGAKAGIMPGDEKLRDWYAARDIKIDSFVDADLDAEYCRKITIDVSKITPQVAKSPAIDNVFDVKEAAGTKVDQVIIGSCTNGRYEDFKVAADILKGKQISEDVRLILVPASRQVYKEMIQNGLLTTFIESGASINPPGCGPCAGLHGGLVGDGEVVLTTTNRNMKGRMGSNKADIHVCSPITAAYAALAGEIVDYTAKE